MVIAESAHRCAMPIAPLGAEVGWPVTPFDQRPAGSKVVTVAGPSMRTAPRGAETPDLLASASRRILDAGIDVLATFPISQGYDTALIVACVARGVVDAHLDRNHQPRWVAGRVGQTDGAFEDVVRGLIDGGVDLLIVDPTDRSAVTCVIDREHRAVPVIARPLVGTMVPLDGDDPNLARAVARVGADPTDRVLAC